MIRPVLNSHWAPFSDTSFKKEHMKKNIKKIALINVLLLTTIAAYGNNLKIGIVNVPTLLDRAPQVAQTDERLAREFKPKETELFALRQELVSLTEKYNRDKSIMSAERARDIERQIANMRKNIQRRHGDIQEEINVRRNQELQVMQDLINKAIQYVGEKETFDLILYDGIAYNNDKADITELVLDYLQSIHQQQSTEDKQP